MRRTVLSLLVTAACIPLAIVLLAVMLAGDAVVAVSRRLLAGRREAGANPQTRDTSRCSIVIPNWNGRNLLAESLPALVAAVQQWGGGHEIIVVDNGSSDGSVDYVRSTFPQVKVLALEQNLGFGRACNLGVQAAGNSLVVLLNNDMVVDPCFLPPLLAPFADERVFAVSSQIRPWDPARPQEETGKTRGGVRGGRLCLWHETVSGDEPVGPCLWAGGGSAAYDRERYLSLGGFDRLYEPFYVEDVDLSYRAWKRGWTVLFAPQSVAYHHHRASTMRLGAAMVERATTKNKLVFVWRNLTNPAWLAASVLRLPGEIGSAVAGGASNDTAALAWALRQLPETLIGRWRNGLQRFVVKDEDIFRVGCSAFHYRERFEPTPQPSASKRILMLCPYLPVPPAHGGAVRMLNLIRQLSQRHVVDVLTFIEKESEEEYADQLAPYCRRLRLVLRRPQFGRYRPLSDRSWYVEEFDTPEMRRAVQEMLDSEDYHILQVEYTQLAQYAPRSLRLRTLLDELDITFLSFYQRQIRGRRLPDRQDVVDWLKLAKYEIESCRRFDRVLAMSDTDAEYLRAYLPERRSAIVTIANGVDCAYYSPAPAWPGGCDLLFVGSHRHPPNQEGMRWFLGHVFPLIQEQLPSVHLWIVGDGPWADMDEVAGNAAVTATGFVDDTRPYLARCAVMVVPILAGAGTRIKILEGMAAGIPIVSTTVGAEGIAVRHQEHVLIADDAGAFARATLDVLRSPELAERLRQNSRRLAVEQYDWAAIAARLETCYDELYAERRADTR